MFLTERSSLQKKVTSYPQTGLNGLGENLANMEPDDILLQSLLAGLPRN